MKFNACGKLICYQQLHARFVIQDLTCKNLMTPYDACKVMLPYDVNTSKCNGSSSTKKFFMLV